MAEKGEVLLRGVGTLRHCFPPSASVQWQPDGLITRSKKWSLGARFLGATPIVLIAAGTFAGRVVGDIVTGKNSEFARDTSAPQRS